MHLINAKTFKLEYFIDGARRPRYAIPSHTWGETEVTFEQSGQLQGDLDSTKAREPDGPGLSKVQ